MSGFSQNYQDRSAMTQGTIWNILNTGFIFLFFLDPYVLVTLRSDGWMDITKIFRMDTSSNSLDFFHAWIDCFTLLKRGAVEVFALGVLLVHTCFSERSDNYEIFWAQFCWSDNKFVPCLVASIAHPFIDIIHAFPQLHNMKLTWESRKQARGPVDVEIAVNLHVVWSNILKRDNAGRRT